MGESPVRFGVRKLQDWPARNSNFPAVYCTQYRRSRSPSELLVTFRFCAVLPRKSASRYPLRSAWPTLLVACSVSREFCAENRVSLRFPAGFGPAVVVVNGKLEKLVPRPLPGLVDRVIEVRS